MTRVSTERTRAGWRLHAFARRCLDRETLERVVEPGLADLQWLSEGADGRPGGRMLRTRVWLGCAAACACSLFLQKRRHPMSSALRASLYCAGIVGVFALAVFTVSLPVPQGAVALLAVLCVAPIVLVAIAASARWGAAVATRLALILIPAGFCIGAAWGWASVPSEWTASLWVTIDASMNAAKYGAAFEHTAERALMYPFFAGIVGALAAGTLSVVATWRTSRLQRATAG
jgi:hypothetical protein